MIKINLHDYRDEIRKIEIQKRVARGFYLLLGIVALIVASWVLDLQKLDGLRIDVQELETQVKALEGDVKEIEGMKAKVKRAELIVAGIDKIRHHQLAATRILGDVNLRVPRDMWLTRINQKSKEDLIRARVPIIFVDDPKIVEQEKKKRRRKSKIDGGFEFLEITGRAFKEQAVVGYLQELEAISYFDLIFLHKTERQLMGVYPVYEFTIYCYLPKDKKTVT